MKKAELEEQLEQQRTCIIDMRNKIQRLHHQLEAEQVQWTLLSQEHNTIVRMIEEVFDIQAGAQHTDGDTPLWDITDRETGERLVLQQRDIAEAYREAISKRIQAKP